MRRPTFRSLIGVLGFSALGFAAEAQISTPMKPGLWRIHSEREVDGKKAPDPSERLKNMSPEQRAKIEAIMKQNGVATGAGGDMQVCYTRELLERMTWADQQKTCKVSFSRRDANVWKWHSSCPVFSSEGDGEAVFPDRENYTVKVASVSTMGGKVQNSRTTMIGKWLGSDCGSVKPLAPPP